MINQKSPYFLCHLGRLSEIVSVSLSSLPWHLVPYLAQKFNGSFGLEAPAPWSWCTQCCGIELISAPWRAPHFQVSCPSILMATFLPRFSSLLVLWFSKEVRHFSRNRNSFPDSPKGSIGRDTYPGFGVCAPAFDGREVYGATVNCCWADLPTLRHDIRRLPCISSLRGKRICSGLIVLLFHYLIVKVFHCVCKMNAH